MVHATSSVASVRVRGLSCIRVIFLLGNVGKTSTTQRHARPATCFLFMSRAGMHSALTNERTGVPGAAFTPVATFGLYMGWRQIF
jgi:hypothetical protein